MTGDGAGAWEHHAHASWDRRGTQRERSPATGTAGRQPCQRFRRQALLDGSENTDTLFFSAEAEPLLMQGYEGLKQRQAKIPPQSRSIRLTEALERLVQLYDGCGKPAEAEKWRKELKVLPPPLKREKR